MVLSLRMPGATRAMRIASLLQALTKGKGRYTKNSIFEYTNPELIEPSKRLNRGVAIWVVASASQS
jgi:hypothetical protein